MNEPTSGPARSGEPETDASRVEVWTTAKGDPQWRVRVRVGESEEEVDRALGVAVRAYRRLEGELAAGAAPAEAVEGWPGAR